MIRNIKSLMFGKQRWLALSISIVVLLVSSFLVSQSLAVSSRQYQQYRDGIAELTELEAQFDREILKSRYELFTNYDLLVENLEKQRSIQQKLQKIPSFVNVKNQEIVESSLQQKLETLEEKEQLSERFKSRNALLKNSLRYLPMLASGVEAKSDRSQEEKGLDPEVFASLQGTLDRLIQNLLLYNIALDREIASKIESLTQTLLNTDIQNKVAKDEFPTETIVSHANIILNTKPQVEVLTSQLVSPSKSSSEDLEPIFEASYQQAVTRVNRYRILTFAWFIGILAMSNYLWLRRSRRQQGPNFLEAKQRVEKITAELTSILANSSNSSDPNRDFSTLETYEKELEKLDGQVQRAAQSLQAQENQLQQQILELKTQLETAKLETERTAENAEKTRLDRQILELSVALEQARSQRKPTASESETADGSIAHLSLLAKHQRQLIQPQMQERLETVLGNALNERGCQPIDFQSSPEQIRLLFRHPPQIQFSKLVLHLKRASSTCLYQEFQDLLQEIKNPSDVWSETYFLTISEANVKRTEA